jgi:hypothetical protein
MLSHLAPDFVLAAALALFVSSNIVVAGTQIISPRSIQPAVPVPLSEATRLR